MNPYIVAMLKRDEGLRLKPYRCTAGKLTIGYGRNLDDVGISEAEAEMLLANDIAKVEREAERFHWYAGLNDARKAVVLNMLFNLGASSFKGFVNTIKAISAGDYDDAANRMLASKWAEQVGARAARLAQIMRTGVV